MKIAGIDFPKPLLNALRNNQLVVFGGAGVSIPEPAGLPTFRQLAEAVALGSGETLGNDEPEDRFLGRLAHKGQQVHLQATEVLRKNTPKPSCLHHDLTALYRNPDSLRIVTTNFDTLFEEAVKARFGTEQEVFRAPALPLGRDFNGIVHLHGSIDSPNDMILTDADFGRAYLSEGWARIFLLDLFRTFTVLFVGYAHNDMVMNYLARALPVDQTPPRFVLTDEADGSRWDILGIKPVFFVKPNKYDYTGLHEGVAGLSEYATRGILDWQSAITRIATDPPSLDQEEMDLVVDGLSDPAHTRFFVEAASNIEWVKWLDENGHLDSLFGTGSRPILEEPARILGRWLALPGPAPLPEGPNLRGYRNGYHPARELTVGLGPVRVPRVAQVHTAAFEPVFRELPNTTTPTSWGTPLCLPAHRQTWHEPASRVLGDLSPSGCITKRHASGS